MTVISWHDYVSSDAILPVTGWLVATGVGVRSLWTPDLERKRILEIVIYSLATLIVAGWYDYSGTQNLRSNRETNREIQTLLALSGISTKEGVNQGLDKIITRNLKPREIIPTQEEEPAVAIEVIKEDLPKSIAITHLPNATPDWIGIAVPIQRALSRNGIKTVLLEQVASSPKEVGLMFTMPDPSNPPDSALKLRDAFGLAGIRNIRFVLADKDYAQFGLNIFVGPPELN